MPKIILIEPQQNTDSPHYWWIMLFFFYMTFSLPPFFRFKNIFWLREGAKNPLQLWSLHKAISTKAAYREQAQSLVPVQLMLYFLLDTQGFTGSHHRSDYKEKVLFAFYKD